MLEVRLPSVEPEAFELLLSYIYTDRIDCKFFVLKKIKLRLLRNYNLLQITILSTVNEQHNNRIVILVMDIYQLAVEYLIRSLENVCLQYLEFKISKLNVLDALYNADKRG